MLISTINKALLPITQSKSHLHQHEVLLPNNAASAFVANKFISWGSYALWLAWWAGRLPWVNLKWHDIATLVQLVQRLASNHKIPGSNPTQTKKWTASEMLGITPEWEWCSCLTASWMKWVWKNHFEWWYGRCMSVRWTWWKIYGGSWATSYMWYPACLSSWSSQECGCICKKNKKAKKNIFVGLWENFGFSWTFRKLSPPPLHFCDLRQRLKTLKFHGYIRFLWLFMVFYLKSRESVLSATLHFCEI